MSIEIYMKMDSDVAMGVDVLVHRWRWLVAVTLAVPPPRDGAFMRARRVAVLARGDGSWCVPVVRVVVVKSGSLGLVEFPTSPRPHPFCFPRTSQSALLATSHKITQRQFPLHLGCCSLNFA